MRWRALASGPEARPHAADDRASRRGRWLAPLRDRLRGARGQGAPSPALALALLVAAADLALLVWVGVGPMRLAIGAAFLVAAGLAGALCLRGREQLFPDRLSFALASLAFGLVLHVVLSFVLLHLGLERALGIEDRRACANFVLWILCALAVLQLLGVRGRLAGLPRCATPGSASVVFALASLVAVTAHFGFGNDLRRITHTEKPPQVNPNVRNFLAHYATREELRREPSAPEWDSRVDSLWYVWLIPRMLEERGLPDAFEASRGDDDLRLEQFQHIGVAIQVLGLTDLSGPYSAHGAAACSKLLALVWTMLMAWWLFLIGHTLLRLPAQVAVLGAAGGLFFSALDVSAFFGLGLRPSNVLGYVATPIYWNLNQLAQLAVGLGGVYLVLRALRDGSSTYALGCVLIACSLLIKPSLYFVAAPALGLATLRPWRGLPRADVLLGWLALGIAAGFWFVYPRLHDLTSLASPIAWSFLELQALYLRTTVLPDTWISGTGPVGVRAAVIVLLFAAWILPLAHQAHECIEHGTARCRALCAELARPEVLGLCLLFAWGMFSACCFVEDFSDESRRNSNNFFFGGAVAYAACMPLLVLAIEKVEPRSLRRVAWGVYACHLASGAANLWLYAGTGRLS